MIDRIKALFFSIFKNEISFENDLELSSKIILLMILYVTAVVFLFIYGIQCVLTGSYLLGAIDLTAGFTALWMTIYFLVKRNYPVSSKHIVFLMGTMFLYLLISGGNENTGHLWLYSFPLFVTFLLGPRLGSIVFFSFISCILLFFITGFPPGAEHYSTNFKLRYIGSVTTVYIVSIFFEYWRQKAQQIIVSKNMGLKHYLYSLMSATKNKCKIT